MSEGCAGDNIEDSGNSASDWEIFDILCKDDSNPIQVSKLYFFLFSLHPVCCKLSLELHKSEIDDGNSIDSYTFY